MNGPLNLTGEHSTIKWEHYTKIGVNLWTVPLHYKENQLLKFSIDIIVADIAMEVPPPFYNMHLKAMY